MQQSTHYKHSGVAPVGGILLTLTGGLVAASLLGALYGFLIFWSPFVYINLFITFGFGVILGTAAGGLAKLGKIRNTGLVSVLALAVALFAYYAHWVVWTELVTEAWILNVTSLSRLLSSIADLGAWSIFAWTPTGFSLWAIWCIEALMVIGVGTFAAISIIDTPFCEDTGQWAKDETLTVHFKPLSGTVIPESPVSLLSNLEPAADEAGTYAEVTVATVDGSELRCVSIDNVVVEADKDGKEDTKKTSLVRHMLFDRENFERLLSLSQGPAANSEFGPSGEMIVEG